MTLGRQNLFALQFLERNFDYNFSTKMQLRDVKLAPFDVLVGTYGSAANLIFHYPLSILVLVAIIFQLKF